MRSPLRSTTSDSSKSLRRMARSRNVRDHVVTRPDFELVVLELFTSQRQLDVVVDPLDHPEGDASRPRLGIRMQSSVYGGEPSAQPAAEARAERSEPGQDRSHVRISVVRLLELQVVDLARHHRVRVENLAVEQIERGEDAPSFRLLAHAPPFVAIINGMVATETTIRVPKYTVASALDRRELTLSPMKSGSFATTRIGK